MRYQRPDGTTFVLAYHSPREWAIEYAARLRDLGCSDAYIAAVTHPILAAEMWGGDDA